MLSQLVSRKIGYVRFHSYLDLKGLLSGEIVKQTQTPT